MKKVMFGLACAAAFGAIADIESSNIVGYNTDTITKQTFNMLSVPFESTNGDGFKLDECFGGMNLVGGATPDVADLIQIWDAATGTYENWFYYSEEGFEEYTGWWDEMTQNSMFEDVYEQGLPAGSTFWYKSHASATMDATAQVSGQVPTAADVTTEIIKGTFNMVAFPYPTSLKLNDTAVADWSKATGGATPDVADLIQIWDAATGTYENWFYYSEEGFEEYTGWWDEMTQNSMFEDVYPNGLQVAKPFWLKALGSGTFDVKFFSPIAD